MTKRADPGVGVAPQRYGQSVAATNSSTPTGRGFSDEAAMHALAALAGPYLPWGSGAMRPAGLVTVCNDIVLKGRHRIVELGSGISTVLLARLLTQRPPPGGFLMATVEHDALWARWVREQLDREGTGTHVTIVRAPLVAHPRADRGLRWYDEAARPRASKPTAAPETQRHVPHRAESAEAVPEPAQAGLCGHRAISGRTCTRDKGHAAKSHRYS